MACRYREELVGKRFISVRSPVKLKIQKISEWEWRSGVVRALSSRDTSSLDLSVLIEFDDIDWSRREWVRIHDIFQLFLVEHTLVWAERPDPDKPKQSISWPGLSFRAVVDKVGLSGCKRKPVEFLVDRFLGLVEEKEIQIFQEGEENSHPTSLLRKEVQGCLKEWLDYQDGQKILLTTPSVLVGYRLEVYRAEGTTQWYTAVIGSYNPTSKTLSVTDDTVLEEHNEDPTLIQMHLIDEGVVDSILRGVEIGGIAPRRRPRAVKQEKEPQNSTSKSGAPATSQTTTVSRSSVARKPRVTHPPLTVVSSTPTATSPASINPLVSTTISQEAADRLENKVTEKPSVKQRQQPNSRDRKRKVESDTENEDSKVINSNKRRSKTDDNKTLTKSESSSSIASSVESSVTLRSSPRNTPSKEKEKTRSQRNREIDKDIGSETLEPDIPVVNVAKTNGPVRSDSDSNLNKVKVKLRRKEDKTDSPSRQIDSPKQSDSPASRLRNESPRSRAQSKNSTQNPEAEAVIKNNVNSGNKKDKKTSSIKKERKNSASAKSDVTSVNVKAGKSNTEVSDNSATVSSSNKNQRKENPVGTKQTNDNSITTEPKSQKGNVKKESVKTDNAVSVSKTKITKPSESSRTETNQSDISQSQCKDKTNRFKNSKKEKENTTQGEDLKTTAKNVADLVKSSITGKEKETPNESGGNMHYIKKKQSLYTGSVPPGNPGGIPTSNIDFNQSVTDQIARAEKLSNLGSEDKAASSSRLPSSELTSQSEQRNDSELDREKDTRENKQLIGSNASIGSLPNSNTNSSWSLDERSQSRNSEERCSSGFSDEVRRPGSRVDELRSSKSSPASSPLIVDKAEPLQIYRDPELMSKNPVRSNVPTMHNSHKSYPPTVHNPIPTQATRPSSVGMPSTPLSSGMERSSRTPVIPSMAYPSALSGIGALSSLPGLIQSGLHHTIDPAALAIHQQIAAVQQQQVAAALASQYHGTLSMSYPPRGPLNSSQLEHLWQQKYPSIPVPPPWLLQKHQDDLVRDIRIRQEQELERERMEQLERDSRERKERERRERERQEKERIDRERREREKIEQERAERERIEREKIEKEKQERDRRERERIERERAERSRILKETVGIDSAAAVDQHFTESLRIASQRNWKRTPNQANHIQQQHQHHHQHHHQHRHQDVGHYGGNATNPHPHHMSKYTMAQTGMWPSPSITLGTGKPKLDSQAMSGGSSYKPNDKPGEIKPEEKIKQEQLRETDYRYAEMMRKHQELMSQQDEYVKQQIYQKRFAQQPDQAVKQEIKPDSKDIKAPGYPGFQPKREPNVLPNSAGKPAVAGSQFSLYGYKPEKYSYISTDQLQSYELDKTKTEKTMMDSKYGIRPPSPGKKEMMSVPPPLIKDTKHSSVIVENKIKDGRKSSSPHANQQYTSHMSPLHQPKPAHTPDRMHDRPSSSASSPGSSISHGMSPSMAHSHHLAALKAEASRQATSRSQSPLRIASPQQLSAAVMQPMDYRCSPGTNKSRGSPGSSGSPHSSNLGSTGAFTPAIAQPPVSLPHSSVSFSYSLIQQGLVPNPIYAPNSNSKTPETQRTVSVTGTAQVPRAAPSPQHGYGGNHSPQNAMSQPGTKRKTGKEGTNRKRPKGFDTQGMSPPGSNNPLNLTVPVTTPQILTNQSPYTTSNVTVSSPSTTQAAASTATSTVKSASQSVIHNRLNSLTGFMDSFKSFVENTVQNAFLSDSEKEAHKRLALEQQHRLHSHPNIPPHMSQPYKPKSSLERSCTPVMSQLSNQTSSNNNEETSNLSNSGNSGNNSGNSASYGETVHRAANGQIDTDSDTLSAPSPPPHMKQDTNTASPHKSAKHPHLKKAWLQRHSDEDKQEVKAVVAPVMAQPLPVPNLPIDPASAAAMLGMTDADKEKDKEQVKNCYVNCSYISPSKEGGTKSPISAIQNVIPNGTVEKTGNVDESTSSASETETQGADSGNPKKRKTKKDRNTNSAKKQKSDTDEPPVNQPVASVNPSTPSTPPVQGKKKTNKKTKETKNKNNTDLSEETIRKIVENCKESSSKELKEKEQKDTKPTEEASKKMLEVQAEIPKQEVVKTEPLSIKDEIKEEAMEVDSSDSGVKSEKREKKKQKGDRKEKKMKKEKVRMSDDEDDMVMPEPAHPLPPPILKETELKAQQNTFSKPLVTVPVSVLKQTCEPFLQDGSCSEVTPKLMKCRECKMTPTQRGKTVPNIFCRFYAFRRLKYSQRGFVTIDGFSELTDADQEDIDPWIPRSPIIEPKIDVETAKFIVRRVSDKFCELVQQEKDALLLAGEDASQIIEPKIDVETAKFIVRRVSDKFCELVQQEKDALLLAGEDAKVAWKRAVTGVREMCDVCDTTLFNMHWVCHKCGFVVCLDCYNVKAKEIKEESDDSQGSDSESEDKKDSDLRKWLTCSANRQPHEVDKLMLTQIIPKDALWKVGRQVNEMRDKWSIRAFCTNSPKVHNKKNGIKTDILDQAIKQLSPKKKLVNGVGGGEEHKSKNRNGNVKSAVYHPENSALSLLADVASMDSEKGRDSDSPYPNKKKEGKNGKSYNPITEPVSPGSSVKKMPANCSTLRELLTKTAGKNAKNKNNNETKKKSKTTNSALNDIIQNVVDQTVVSKHIPKDVETLNNPAAVTAAEQEPMKLLHYIPKLGASHALVRETPIVIHNLTETSVLYPDVPHSWLCNGRLLRLHDPRHKGNLKIFMDQWRRGQPVLVSGVDRYMNTSMWKPEFFSKQFGELENDLINCRTGCMVVGQPMKHFWDGFNVLEERLVDEEGVPMLLKLKDWPPSDDFSDVLPQQFNDLMQALPLPEYTRRDGRLNLVSRLPDFLVKPDLGPKMYIAYGSAQYPKEGTTNLHLDVSDACNVMVYVGFLEDEHLGRVEKDEVALKAIDMAGCDSITKRRVQEVREVAGALWHIFDACDADKIRDFLNKVAKEKGETIEINHDPIHDQSWYLDEALRDRLAKEYGVFGYTIIQCLGDSIFIPAGAPHQVRNLNNCIKVAEDFVSPENIHHCFRLTEEFRDLSEGHSNHEDKLQVKNIIYHAVKDSVTVLQDAEPEEED